MSSAPLSYFRAGTGPPLVLIHGIGSQWQVWKPVLDRLTPERDVIALDLPGFAASPMPAPGTAPGIATLTRLVREFLDGLGLERPHVAGNSLGGWIALELAQQGAVSTATALSPGGFANLPEGYYAGFSLRLSVRVAQRLAPRARGIMRYRLLRQLALGQLFAKPLRVPPDDAAASLRAFVAAAWFEDTMAAIGTGRYEPFPQPTVPVTIAWGEKDHVLLPWQAKRAARAIPSARILTLRGCGHVPTYDDPDQVARVLLEGSRPS